VDCCLVLSVYAAQADDNDATAHDLAAQCAAKNGLYDASTGQCAEPSQDSPSGDLVVGPMMKVLGEEAQKELGEDVAPAPGQ
jgi:nitrite reductase/ring-hydroxylating ferredoxin subunit